MLYLYNFSVESSPSTLQFWEVTPHHPFVMKTCQRTLVISHVPLTFTTQQPETELVDEMAYNYVLEMLCGLKSRLIAENEITAQFRQAFDAYLLNIKRDSQIILFLQKFLQDAKKVRTNHLLGISQKTYAALSRKILKKKNTDNAPILVYGTGQLAEDLINQFKKSNEIFITGRNESKLKKLSHSHDIKPIEWRDFNSYTDFDFQLNTIGTKEIIFNSQFFNGLTVESFFIDLGSPSPVCKSVHLDKKRYYGLDNIYKAGAIENEEKKKKILEAKDAIGRLSAKRIQWFQDYKERKRERLNEKIHDWDKRKPLSKSSGSVY